MSEGEIRVGPSFLPKKMNRHRITHLPKKMNRHRITHVRDPVRIAEGPTAMDAATQRRHFGFRLVSISRQAMRVHHRPNANCLAEWVDSFCSLSALHKWVALNVPGTTQTDRVRARTTVTARQILCTVGT